MRFLSGLLLVATATACGQPAGPDRPIPPTPAPPSQATPAPEPPAVGSLAGEWRVAGIDGGSVDEPVGLSLTGNEQQLWWEPRCAGVARAYRIQGRRITFSSAQPPAPPGSPTPPVCSIGLPPRLDEVARALDDASSITRTPANGVLISGPTHSLTLFAQ